MFFLIKNIVSDGGVMAKIKYELKILILKKVTQIIK